MKAAVRTINKSKFDRVWNSGKATDKRYHRYIDDDYEMISCVHGDHFYISEHKDGEITYWRSEKVHSWKTAIDELKTQILILKGNIALSGGRV